MTLTVLAPAETGLLITADDLRLELGVTGSDLILDRLVEEASGIVTNLCNRATMRRATYKQTERPAASRGVDLISLEEELAAEIQAVNEDGVALASSAWEADGGLVYRLDGSGQRMRWTASTVEVVYDAGYEADGIPPALRRAALLVGTMLWQQRGRDQSIKAETLEGVVSIQYASTGLVSAITPDTLVLVQPYRRWVV